MVKRGAGYVLILLLMGVNAVWAVTGMEVFTRYKIQEKNREMLAKTLVLVQTMSAENMETEVTLYKKGKKSRIESIVKKSSNPMMGEVGMKNIVIDDGISAWVFSPLTGKTEEPNDQGTADEELPRQVDYLSTESVAGIDCHKIKAIYSNGEYEILWIDIRNDVLVKKEYFSEEEKEITLNSDFKTVNGIMFPWQMKIENNGIVQKMKIKSLKVNVSIPDSLFDHDQVTGYEDASTGVQENLEQTSKIMEMITEIQRLYQNGETKKAEALEKKMQQMMQ